MASCPITSWQIEGEKVEAVTNFIFLGSKITVDSNRCHEIKRCLLLGRKAMSYLDSIFKIVDISQSYGFSSNHAWVWQLDHKEGWALKDWCFWNALLEKTLERPLDCKEIKSVNPKGNQSWIFIERTDAEAEVPILCPPDEKSWLIRRDPDAEKDWG